MKPENRFDCNKDLCPSQGSTQFFTTKEDKTLSRIIGHSGGRLLAMYLALYVF